jgi:hypothetical protein
MITDLLAVPHREALILFHDTGANRLHSSSSAKKRGKPEVGRDMFAELENPPEPSAEKIAEVEAEEMAWQNDHEEILKEAFGNIWPDVKAELDRSPLRSRRRLLRDRFVDSVNKSGALYVIPVAIEDHDGKHHYYLVHASTHPRAHYVMKESIDKAMRAREHATNFLPGLSFQSEANIHEVVKKIAHRFAGKSEVRWDDHSDEENTVKFFAFAETEAQISDREELLGRLEKFEVRKRPRTYRFPLTS